MFKKSEVIRIHCVLPILSQMEHTRTEIEKLPVEVQIVNTSGFVVHAFSVATPQFCCCSMETVQQYINT